VKLSDIVSGAGLAAYAEIALILFFLAFLVIVVTTMAKGRNASFEAASRMPLDDIHPQEPRNPNGDA
jgi:cbb3-type cytochrome oxidase subunit 3